MTHEFGHAFGLDDLDEDTTSTENKYATMFWQSFPCRKWQRTLGKGDLLGLRSIY